MMCQCNGGCRRPPPMPSRRVPCFHAATSAARPNGAPYCSRRDAHQGRRTSSCLSSARRGRRMMPQHVHPVRYVSHGHRGHRRHCHRASPPSRRRTRRETNSRLARRRGKRWWRPHGHHTAGRRGASRHSGRRRSGSRPCPCRAPRQGPILPQHGGAAVRPLRKPEDSSSVSLSARGARGGNPMGREGCSAGR